MIIKGFKPAPPDDDAMLRRILAEREAELLAAKGPCGNSGCHLHRAHSGPCNTAPPCTQQHFSIGAISDHLAGECPPPVAQEPPAPTDPLGSDRCQNCGHYATYHDDAVGCMHYAGMGGDCGCQRFAPLPAGLYGKYRIERTDGRSAPGQKHDCCQYFVLDRNHDPHAAAAIQAYAESCRAEFPELAADLAPGGAQEPADPPLWLTAAQAAAHTSMRQDAGAWYDALPRAVLAALPILRAGIEAELIAKIAAWASVNEIAAPPLDWAALSVILNGVQS